MQMKSISTITFLYLTTALPLNAVAQNVDPFAHMPTPAFAGQTRAPAVKTSISIKVETLLSNLTGPRSLAVLPDGKVLVTEGAGTIHIIHADGTVTGPVSGLPPIRSVMGRSLNDFIVDANFAQNRRVFFTYSAPPDGEPGGPKTPADREAWSKLSAQERQAHPFQIGRVASARLSEDCSRLENVKIIYSVLGRRLVSGKDGKLFITTWGYTEQDLPLIQKLDNTIGKMLRLNADGSVPKDNPFVGHADALPEVYDYGHRDPDGAFLHPQTGELWNIEHGPMGGDELNIIRPGNNYGWPEVTYGRNYDGTAVSELTQREDTTQPIYYWYPSVAPAGLLFYTGTLFPEWQGNIFVGTMSPTQGKFLARLVIDGEKVVAVEHLLGERDRRVRNVAQGIDGALYVLTDSENNDQTNRHFVGEVLRLTPTR
ncbi:MAG: gdhB [Gammaproteobacteria bacterium]|nr:gdhB [Gammaproteobacteria bacterium]